MRRRFPKGGERIFRIKAVLSDYYGRVKGMPYRVLAVPEGFTLYGLGEAILYAFDFCFDHAFGFYDNVKNWTLSSERYELFKDLEEGTLTPDPFNTAHSVKKTRVRQAFDIVGKMMLFLFDYGEEWRFILRLEAIEHPKEGVKYPLIVKSVGEPPPQYEEIEDDRAEG